MCLNFKTLISVVNQLVREFTPLTLRRVTDEQVVSDTEEHIQHVKATATDHQANQWRTAGTGKREYICNFLINIDYIYSDDL